MPTLVFQKKELEKLAGRKAGAIDFSAIKAEAELSGGELKVELQDTNRPDLWSVEGIARQFRPRKEYRACGRAGVVDAGSAPKVRPYIAASVVKGLSLDGSAIKSIMLAQEKLDETVGRGRRVTSIGLYRFDDIRMPVVYGTTKADKSPFIPLGFRRVMTPGEILAEHPKGVEYGHIIAGITDLPIFKDSGGKILSLPPVINSDDLGKIDEKTKSILVEVTGTDEKMVSRVLTLMTLCLADRGGKIYSVEVRYDKRRKVYPELKPVRLEVNLDSMDSLLGFAVKSPEKLLESMHYRVVSRKGRKMVVEAQPYRWDIMHQADVFEDVAIAYGFSRIEPREPELPTKGALDDEELLSDKVRELLAGVPLLETMGMVLTNPTFQADAMNLEKAEVMRLSNPMSESYSCVRRWMLPSLVEFLSRNTNKDYPQGIFEVGEVVVPARNYLRSETRQKVAVAIARSDATFTAIKSVLDALVRNLGRNYSITRLSHLSFIEGRCGSVTVSGKKAGFIGELHPQVLENWGIKVPVCAFEIDLETLG